jgi:putative endonuclease
MFWRKKSPWKVGEDLAAKTLRRAGMRILQRNYRCHIGEIDIIALDADDLVFVEVKTLQTDAIGDPEENIHDKKQRQIERTARHYLKAHRAEHRPCRFDVVAIVLGDDETDAKIRHHRDAFDARAKNT